MKHGILLIAALLLFTACGPQQQVIVGNDQDEELIDVGYGRVRKQDNTTAATRVNIDKRAETYNNIYDYLRGRVAGLYVGTSNNPGEAPEMYIRGVNSINSDITPLILVDGSEMSNISALDPANVRSVSVLKGPEAAIYGARGANGVILISTKAR